MIKFLASVLCRLANGDSDPVCNFLASVPRPKLPEVFIVDSESVMSDAVYDLSLIHIYYLCVMVIVCRPICGRSSLI